VYSLRKKKKKGTEIKTKTLILQEVKIKKIKGGRRDPGGQNVVAGHSLPEQTGKKKGKNQKGVPKGQWEGKGRKK